MDSAIRLFTCISVTRDMCYLFIISLWALLFNHLFNFTLAEDQIDYCGEAAGWHTIRQRCPEAEVVMREIKDQDGSYLFELLKNHRLLNS